EICSSIGLLPLRKQTARFVRRPSMINDDLRGSFHFEATGWQASYGEVFPVADCWRTDTFSLVHCIGLPAFALLQHTPRHGNGLAWNLQLNGNERFPSFLHSGREIVPSHL